MLKKEKRELWKQEHRAIKKWLDNVSEVTASRYLLYAYEYFIWINNEGPEQFKGKTPEQLLDLQDACVRHRERFQQVDLLQIYLNKRHGAYRTKELIKSTIYSYYASNRVPLPKDTTFKIQPDRPRVNGFMSIEELKQIILSSNELYQAVYTIMFQSSMGISEFKHFNTHCWKQVKEQLDEGKQVIRVDLPGRKHMRMKPSGNYFTFFGKDAITKLKTYLTLRERLEQRDKQRAPPLEQAIFINEKYKPLTQQDISTYFKRHAWRLGIIKKVHHDERVRYRVHCHEMRDTFRTEWNLTTAKPFMAEFFMGHAVDPNKYNKIMQRAKWAKEQYRLAEPFLNILSEDPRTVETKDINRIVEERVKERVKDLEARLRDLEQREEQRRRALGIPDIMTEHQEKAYENLKKAFKRLMEESRVNTVQKDSTRL